MRVISEEKLIKLAFRIDDHNTVVSLDDALAECQELQEPWMTLDEFLKSGFVGACWVYTNTEFVYTAYYAEDGQFYESDFTECRLDKNTIVKVMPIHKPEPLR